MSAVTHKLKTIWNKQKGDDPGHPNSLPEVSCFLYQETHASIYYYGVAPEVSNDPSKKTEGILTALETVNSPCVAVLQP